MSATKKTRTLPPRATVNKIEYVDGPQYASFYCNNIGFAVNQTDVVLTVGEILEATPQRALVEKRARITMSAVQTKILLFMLAQNLAQYEATFGPIALPKDIEDRMAQAKTAKVIGEGK